MSGISTHILDTEKGRPAGGIDVRLERYSGEWEPVSTHRTDENGRIARFLSEGEPLTSGLYRLTFQTGGVFFPEVCISFRIDDTSSHYHVPLLLSSYGYTTYRGS